ncbi:hypothetical protein [Nocardiopsis algeriensis]|uniref:Uncharacterized protein n=1 Tax=Nocardiopsis algeriensis TaxID=1478215 RepID=A0A841IK87_9ACTN|nr:hypothetical protein [Nocardiopsis algeriensis]MBB6118374.1 hypothetical protein [Nocardiopsis algeriensis]
MTADAERVPVPRHSDQGTRPFGSRELPRRRNTTELYDQLSEVLRTRPRHAGEAYQLMREADRLLSTLDHHLRSGARLPEPWRQARS